ncbi:Crp/Fnr family transcriptional regulator [Adhaeribacter radiodurans]|uniref:Crp/Fnr family transcriptional regulator n=1 Tax=Adhaeribacter radiodurans TaxID=2745197 RepID=A0A7L7L4C3_9BACT|nr:Crp/Fnr family transcriptional regulator [Adhaeribacter radiodurans]QMU27662.1 Crp/Fnr family transcriptional regulator [Adhaeribacter radiodurans]
MTELYAFIQSIAELSEKSWNILRADLISLTVPKGDYLVREGEICASIYFITKGYCRAFYNQDGMEINTAFFFENSFTTNIKSLTQNVPSDYFIQACEDLKVIKLQKTKLLEAYQKSHEIESFGRKLLELMISRQEEHSNLFKLLTAGQRYEYLTKNHPEILQRVSLSQISSYLGVSRETVSRIRNKNLKK